MRAFAFGILAFVLTSGIAVAQTVTIEPAPTDHTVAIPKEKLAAYFKDMDAKKLATLRMIEGGKYNVNIRRITNAETALVHPQTVDVWVVVEGSGMMTSGGKIVDGKIVGGQSHAQTGRRRIHSADSGARRERRQRQHYLPQHPLGRGLGEEIEGSITSFR